MPTPAQLEEVTRAFANLYDEMLRAMGVPCLLPEQRDVLLSMLDAAAEKDPRLIEALQDTQAIWRWVDGKVQT